MSNIWIWADDHFSHKNICFGESNWPDKSGCRNFKTVEEHDEYLINITNKYVKSTDIAYNLGDFGLGFGFKDKFKQLRERIKCQTIFLAKGNHDSIFQERNRNKYPELFSLFKEVRDVYAKKLCGTFFVMQHYAQLTWQYQHHGSIMCHGHSHNNLKYPGDMAKARILDVGRDTHHYGHELYAPYSVEEIIDIINKNREIVSLDHHSSDTN